MIEWMRTDSRYRHTVVHPPLALLGGYLRNYEQEYTINHLIACGAGAFDIMAGMLIRIVDSVARSLRRPTVTHSDWPTAPDAPGTGIGPISQAQLPTIRSPL